MSALASALAYATASALRKVNIYFVSQRSEFACSASQNPHLAFWLSSRICSLPCASPFRHNSVTIFMRRSIGTLPIHCKAEESSSLNPIHSSTLQRLTMTEAIRQSSDDQAVSFHLLNVQINK